MADMMADAATWWTGQLVDNLSQTVTYRRGSLSVSLTATKCTVRAESTPEGNVDFHGCDWLIKAALLILGGATVEPNKNDVIEESDGEKWQVLPLAGEPEFRYSDQFRTCYRIHTKRTAEPT